MATYCTCVKISDRVEWILQLLRLFNTVRNNIEMEATEAIDYDEEHELVSLTSHLQHVLAEESLLSSE